MVSNAREDLPEPLGPVITTRRSRGSDTLTFLRLCCRAPRTTSRSIGGTGELSHTAAGGARSCARAALPLPSPPLSLRTLPHSRRARRVSRLLDARRVFPFFRRAARRDASRRTWCSGGPAILLTSLRRELDYEGARGVTWKRNLGAS